MLDKHFSAEWQVLTAAQRSLVLKDFRQMLLEEYDTPDDTMSNEIAKENARTAAIEYKRRIGSGNLTAYVKSLEASRK